MNDVQEKKYRILLSVIHVTLVQAMKKKKKEGNVRSTTQWQD